MAGEEARGGLNTHNPITAKNAGTDWSWGEELAGDGAVVRERGEWAGRARGESGERREGGKERAWMEGRLNTHSP